MPLQLNTIEEYSFVHGLHRNYVNGKYIAIQPHDLGRPLTHAEMDYNLILNEQTQAGFRIFGSNPDLTLSDDDIGQSLLFHKITANDADLAKYQSKGYSIGQYIWILSCCEHDHCEFFTADHHDGITATDSEWCQFVVDTIASEDSGVCAFEVDSITVTPEDPCVTFVVETIVAQDSLVHEPAFEISTYFNEDAFLRNTNTQQITSTMAGDDTSGPFGTISNIDVPSGDVVTHSYLMANADLFENIDDLKISHVDVGGNPVELTGLQNGVAFDVSAYSGSAGDSIKVTHDTSAAAAIDSPNGCDFIKIEYTHTVQNGPQYIEIKIEKVPSYTSVKTVPPALSEGESGEFVLEGRFIGNVGSPDITVPYTITGIEPADIDIPLTGIVTMNKDIGSIYVYEGQNCIPTNNKRGTLIYNVLNDSLVEGLEELKIEFGSVDSEGTTISANRTVGIVDVAVPTPTPSSSEPVPTATATSTPTPTPSSSEVIEPSYNNLTAQTQLNEGQVALYTLTSSNIPNGATVGYTLSGILADDLYTESEMTGTFTMSNNTDQITIRIWEDQLTEGLENMVMTLDATDSNGVAAGLTTSIDIIDTSVGPTPTPSSSATPTPTPSSSEPVPTFALTNNGPVNEGQDLIFTLTTTNIPNGTEVAFTTGGDATTNVDYTDNLPHKFVINNNTATWTVTTLIDNSFDGSTPESLLVLLNATDSLGNDTGSPISNGQIYDMDPEPTSTPTPTPTPSSTNIPTYSLSVNGPVDEGSDLTFTLTTTGLQDNDVVPFGLGGTASVNVNEPWLGDYSPVTPTEFVITNNSATYTVTTYEDNLTESGEFVDGRETVVLTLSAFDSQGNDTSSISKTGEIVDTSRNPNDRYQMTVDTPIAEESVAGNLYMQFEIQAINSYDPAPGTTVEYTITGDWEFGDIQVMGVNTGDYNNISSPVPNVTVANSYTNVFKIGTQGGLKTAAIRVYAVGDAITEGSESVRVTLATLDSTGNTTSTEGIWVNGLIFDPFD
jgi:hypothetical protein